MHYEVIDAQISPNGRLEVLSRAEVNNLLDRGHDGLHELFAAVPWPYSIAG